MPKLTETQKFHLDNSVYYIDAMDKVDGPISEHRIAYYAKQLDLTPKIILAHWKKWKRAQ